MDIIVVSSSSVSMYSMNPFATRSCQPSSGASCDKGKKKPCFKKKKLLIEPHDKHTS